ncbi:type VI secretion system baseplate subunit TssE [Pseudomonas sp. 21LCFQ02]|uniref:type VI secretion system baseplate subunit TssE n=1 Tax=unclassified Pseudomonas TaxID=196821 RepID=UPI00209B778B|nr:type VI secretion system baseplate subunit TssE [Pseudomonas sp. 21LCFQ02]MCQ9422386.1 type VI secretion system baseplate subunit TssE [Pseudomonas sp. LJDD11]
MTGYGSLFERLGGEAARRCGMSHEAAVTDSVASHLQRMLGTRAGSVQIRADYGLPDLNNLHLSLYDALSQARAAIEAFITAHEPRLAEVRVIPLPAQGDPLRLAFALEALLVAAGVRRPLRWQVRLQAGGQVCVES